MATGTAPFVGVPSMSRQLLDISHLDEVLDLVRKAADYELEVDELGLLLGLDNKVNGLRQCLAAWLEQVHDVKSGGGGPTYHVLIQALRKMGKNAVADGIDKEKHPACTVFTQWESNESILAALPSLAVLLYKEKIIDKMLFTGQELLKAMKDAVCADCHNLKKFAEILTELQNRSIEQSLLGAYERSLSADCTTRQKVTISVPGELCPEFTQVCSKFTTLKENVAKAMEKKVEINKLKEYFCTNKSHLKSRIDACTKVEELIENSCSLINITLLEKAVERFKIEEAKPAVQQYKKETEELYKKRLPLRKFSNKCMDLVAIPLHYKTATISVHERMNNFELADIMTVIFQKMVPEVNLEFVIESNSFIVTCSFPVLLSESLIATALDNIDSLIERGVEKLTIGYSTVYDHEKAIEIFQYGETITSKPCIALEADSVYSSQGTMEQLLISRTIQLLNSEEELTSVQQLKEKNAKLEVEIKVLSGMKWEVDQLRTREMENTKEVKILQEKISMLSLELLENKNKLQKVAEEKEAGKKAKLPTVQKQQIPAPTLPPYETQLSDADVKGIVKDIRILLMTATENELSAVLGYLKPLDGRNKVIETFINGTWIYVGKYGNFSVVVGRSAYSKGQQGLVEADDVTKKIMEIYKPKYIIAIGVCFGMDSRKVQLSDVIVSEFIVDLTTFRIGEESITLRRPQLSAGKTLFNFFGNTYGFEMKHSYEENAKKVKVHCGPILCTSILVDNDDFKKRLGKVCTAALAGEMEGAGIFSAARDADYKVEAIVIKAVGDWGDGKKDACKSWKDFASHAAARYVHYYLDNFSPSFLK